MNSPSSRPPNQNPTTLRRKTFLLLSLILSLSLLSDVQVDDNGDTNDVHDNDVDTDEKRHLALLTALTRHPPSLRVFRLVFTGAFMLYMSALALMIWERNVCCEYIGGLLFDFDYGDVSCRTEEEEVHCYNVGDGDECGDEEFNGPTFNRKEIQMRAPSSQSVLSAALDLSILSCACLICFTVASSEGGRYIDTNLIHANIIDNNINDESVNEASSSYLKIFCEATAPLFPLGLFCIVVYKVLFPWKMRGRVWISLAGMTIGAPFYEVTFRDGFIGDILTSTVRPLQDLLFTLFFLPLGLHAYWSSYTVDSAAIPIERNWIVHTLLLPACTLSPQWWRFCQNLRQCYDAKRRWPYLGNALKYMTAAEVATFGMFDPSMKQHPLWIISFALATLYQVCWDVFMDWGLLHWDYYEKSFVLREERLYKRKWVYHLIFGVNFLLRFVGMITLIPTVHLSRTTGLIVKTFPEFEMFVGSLAGCAEIFRRTVWALLRVEWEVVKMRSGKSSTIRQWDDDDDDMNNVELSGLEDGNEMKPMAISIESSVGKSWTVNFNSLKSFRLSDMTDLNDIQIITELCLWAIVFSGVAIIAAAHRDVL